MADIRDGDYDVHVYVHGKGFARVKQKAQVGVLVSKVTPNTGSINGGSLLTIKGSGFAKFASHNFVKLGDRKCTVTKAVSATELQCRVDKAPEKPIAVDEWEFETWEMKQAPEIET